MSVFVLARIATPVVFVYVPLLFAWLAVACRGRGRLIWGALATVVVCVGVDAFFVEPRALEVTEVRVESENLAKPIRIGLFSDIQLDTFGAYEKQAFATLMAGKPDVILLAGDYIQADSEPERLAFRAQVNAYLREIHFGAPLGVFAVQGNMEVENDWPSLFEGLGVTTFERSNRVVRDAFSVAGLTLDDSFRQGQSFERTPGKLSIALGHAPDFALGQHGADLLVAGHTHGGQVRLPFVGPLLTFSGVPRAWAAGVTTLPYGGTLVVSRGVGVERREAPQLRFLCRPQLMFITVSPRRSSPAPNQQ
ncbi:MAG: hypothetical protein HOO96_05940 [Polyangiaceae bacterium]|nr:hypothetical protein [Polyangiaceae bacterium]